MVKTNGNILFADTLSELLKFARAMGMSEAWLQGEREQPHFKIFGNCRKLIMREVSGGRVIDVRRAVKEATTGAEMAQMR